MAMSPNKKFTLQFFGILVLMLVFVVGFVWFIQSLRPKKSYTQQLVEQCVADGRKEYECYALIYGGR